MSSWNWVRDGCSLPHAESALQWLLSTGPSLCVSVEAACGFPSHTVVLIWWWGRTVHQGFWVVTQGTDEVPRMLPDCPPSLPSGYSFIPTASNDQWLHRHCRWWPLRNLPHSSGIWKCYFFFNVTIKPLRGWVIKLSCCWSDQVLSPMTTEAYCYAE